MRRICAAWVYEVDEDARPEFDPHASDDLYVAMLFSTVSAGMPEEVLALTERVARPR